jgi:hypothetical protein
MYPGNTCARARQRLVVLESGRQLEDSNSQGSSENSLLKMEVPAYSGPGGVGCTGPQFAPRLPDRLGLMPGSAETRQGITLHGLTRCYCPFRSALTFSLFSVTLLAPRPPRAPLPRLSPSLSPRTWSSSLFDCTASISASHPSRSRNWVSIRATSCARRTVEISVNAGESLCMKRCTGI